MRRERVKKEEIKCNNIIKQYKNVYKRTDKRTQSKLFKDS